MNGTSPSPAPKPPAASPPTPKVFSGPQGALLIILLLLAVIGWILYANEVTSAPKQATSVATTNANKAVTNTNAATTYVPIDPVYAGESITLPSPATTGTVAVEAALQSRRSVREFDSRALTQAELSQMLWSAQGVTDREKGGRTAPSGHSLYPIETYVVIRNVENIAPGVYHYLPGSHAIRAVKLSATLLTGEKQQPSVKAAPAVLAYGGVVKKAQTKYPEEATAQKVIYQESGHIGQNVYLEAEAIGLGTVVVAGFDATAVRTELELPEDETIVYLQPFGAPKSE